ncbi:hypothetical protein EXN66_Car009183 [Channa argus]|uniref:Uncharacterized protein n=1 Tax=Channa argus TaxID=215402 RepID=A0A6G1PTE6_CHAAH|nr:hypothetical protein EXN66_Car009183 [Channa argus]
MCRLILTAGLCLIIAIVASAVPIDKFCSSEAITTAPIPAPKTTTTTIPAGPNNEFCKGNKPTRRTPILFTPVPMG